MRRWKNLFKEHLLIKLLIGCIGFAFAALYPSVLPFQYSSGWGDLSIWVESLVVLVTSWPFLMGAIGVPIGKFIILAYVVAAMWNFLILPQCVLFLYHKVFVRFFKLHALTIFLTTITTLFVTVWMERWQHANFQGGKYQIELVGVSSFLTWPTILSQGSWSYWALFLIQFFYTLFIVYGLMQICKAAVRTYRNKSIQPLGGALLPGLMGGIGTCLVATGGYFLMISSPINEVALVVFAAIFFPTFLVAFAFALGGGVDIFVPSLIATIIYTFIFWLNIYQFFRFIRSRWHTRLVDLA